MKVADDGDSRIAPLLGEVVGSQNQVAGALARAKERNWLAVQKPKVAEDRQPLRGARL
jgi:hypothetical protein